MVGSVTTEELFTKPTAKPLSPQLTEFLQPWELVQSDFYPQCLSNMFCTKSVKRNANLNWDWVSNVKHPNVIVRLCSSMIVGGLIDRGPLIAFSLLRKCLAIVWDSSAILDGLTVNIWNIWTIFIIVRTRYFTDNVFNTLQPHWLWFEPLVERTQGYTFNSMMEESSPE